MKVKSRMATLGDIHDLVRRAVTKIAGNIQILIIMVTEDAIEIPHIQITADKVWRAPNWRPEHL